MKRLLCLSLCAISCSASFSQVRFNSIFETGISLPVGAKAGSALHNSNGISIGNHMDLSFGEGKLFWGVGAYIGNINTNGVSDKFKETGMLIARKFQLQPSQLVFNSTSFQSTQFLLGPVAGISCYDFNMRIWAKGGFGIADPARYSVAYREGVTEQKIYVSNASDNKNGLSYDLGAGFYYLMTRNLGIQLSASYNNTKTNQINYSYEQEKGTLPSYQTANNAFIKASIGLVVNIGGGENRRDVRTYTGGRRNAREAGSGMATGRRAINTSRSNVKSPTRAESREAGSGMATGRRMHKPLIIRIESPADEEQMQAVTPRDAASGLATGKRMHKPLIIRIESPADEEQMQAVTPRDAASGLATGKRMHKPFVIKIDNGYDEPYEVVVENNAITNNPLYTAPVGGGENPLSQGKSISEKGPKRTEKGIQEKGIKRTEEEKGINEAGLSSDKGINQAGVQKTVNTSRANIKRVENVNCKDGDCDVDCVLEIDGEEYTIRIKGGTKTRRRVEVLKSN